MWDTAGEARTNSQITFSYGSINMDVPVLADQQELTYSSSVLTQDVVWMDERGNKFKNVDSLLVILKRQMLIRSYEYSHFFSFSHIFLCGWSDQSTLTEFCYKQSSFTLFFCRYGHTLRRNNIYRFCLDWFHGVSTIVGHLMPNIEY